MLSKERLGEIREQCQYVSVTAMSTEDLLALVDEIERLRSALSFYADEKNWDIGWEMGQISYDESAASIDGGARARDALGGGG